MADSSRLSLYPESPSLVVPAKLAGGQKIEKQLSADELQRINENGFIRKETKSELIVGVRETSKSLLVFHINKKMERMEQNRGIIVGLISRLVTSATIAHKYTAYYCNNDGTTQFRAAPDTEWNESTGKWESRPGPKDAEFFKNNSTIGFWDSATKEQYDKIDAAPKGLLKFLNYHTPDLIDVVNVK